MRRLKYETEQNYSTKMSLVLTKTVQDFYFWAPSRRSMNTIFNVFGVLLWLIDSEIERPIIDLPGARDIVLTVKNHSSKG